MPLPNRTGVYDDTQNYGANEVAQNPYHFLSGGGNQLSARNKLTMVGRESMYEQYNGALSTISPTRTTSCTRELGGMVDDIETFSPTLVGDLRIGLTRYDPYYGQASAGYDPTKLASHPISQPIPRIS